VEGIVAAWLRHSVTSQTPETEKSVFRLLEMDDEIMKWFE